MTCHLKEKLELNGRRSEPGDAGQNARKSLHRTSEIDGMTDREYIVKQHGRLPPHEVRPIRNVFQSTSERIFLGVHREQLLRGVYDHGKGCPSVW